MTQDVVPPVPPSGQPSKSEQSALEAGDEVALSLTIARRYYLQDESKVAIGKTLGLSRFQVARMLHDGRRRGLVRIEIGWPGRIDPDLSAALKRSLGLEEAAVVETQLGSPRSSVEHVGKALADRVSASVHEGDTLGLTWSRPTVVMTQNLTRIQPCTVVQLTGAIYPPDGLPGSVEITRHIASLNGTAAHAVYAPLVVPDPDTAQGLRGQPEIAATMALYDHVDVAVLSVGAWVPSGSAVYDLLEPEERLALTKAGVCGEISGRLFDVDGRPVATSLDERVIGIEADRLKAIPRLITSSFGAHRRDATIAAVRAGFVHTLVVDEELARAMIS